MFKLNRLELSGFKSFVDPVNLEVSGNLTAIVGPNGCGKSNIADAFVWVLGERSAKSLRGEKMEDVIFAGAKTRRPLGMAEVNLELLTENGFAQAEDGRIRIGRRIFRTGAGNLELATLRGHRGARGRGLVDHACTLKPRAPDPGILLAST